MTAVGKILEQAGSAVEEVVKADIPLSLKGLQEGYRRSDQLFLKELLLIRELLNVRSWNF